MSLPDVSSNLWKIPLLRAMRSFMLIMPTLVLFFEENGLSLAEVFLLQSLFSASVIVLEIPTGYLSDRFGRKRSIIAGIILSSLGFTLYAASSGFWGFLFSETLLGFGVSFISGSDSAMLYDSLDELGRSGEYQRVEGRNTSLSMTSEAVASVLGGLLAIVSLRFPMYFEAAVMWCAVPLSFSLVEPKRETLQSKISPFLEMARLTKYTLHEHKELKWLTLYSSVVGASTLTMVWFIQPYLKESGLPIGYFGVVWAGFMLTGAYFSWHAHGIERTLGRQRSLFALVLLPIIGYVVLGCFESLVAASAILLFYVVRGIHNPVLSDYINGLVGSDIRASILSVKNLVGRVIFSVFGPIVGWIRDEYSLAFALLASGGIFLLLGIIAFLSLLRLEKA